MDFAQYDWNQDREWTVEFDGVRSDPGTKNIQEKEKRYEVRVLWDCENIDKKTFTKTFEDIMDYILNPTFIDAVNKSLKKKSEKSAAKKVKEIHEEMKKAQNEATGECKICYVHELDSSNFSIFLKKNTAYEYCHSTHVLCNTCAQNWRQKTCPFCRESGRFHSFENE
ncbi:Oidioi.mRNA.OKI2018_I69.chr2.g4832.t1.cds [Oikopleura dioica]|uniref:Oidioi.mRNA.OKI2018_I69.chr2.g4832.t1.cds n=1 Tax=Oikopleura dioica TaxID=34765 RepID=A0ABN7T558_OIKDI|nr:Oidioi.mRNA.OKI2018_I69.chr2.g4832.t1.cds [Oikopleura dioica]